jgi:hypothetical protein
MLLKTAVQLRLCFDWTVTRTTLRFIGTAFEATLTDKYVPCPGTYWDRLRNVVLVVNELSHAARVEGTVDNDKGDRTASGTRQYNEISDAYPTHT